MAENNAKLTNTVDPIIGLVPDERLKAALYQSFTEAGESIGTIEGCFRALPGKRWSEGLLATFFSSWKASHLKMLGIYGLSCRLQRLALTLEGRGREQLLIAGAKNGETSYEDLGLESDGRTHAELYDIFAQSFLSDASWQLEENCLPQAKEFKGWIYRNMVVDDIATGLLTNLFSEIYNHGEYSLALAGFSSYIDNHCDFSPEQRARALRYVSVHVENNTEVNHFLVVLEALNRYSEVMNTAIDYETAGALFKEYLGRLGKIMEGLSILMVQEKGVTN